jgi:aminopeptidase N
MRTIKRSDGRPIPRLLGLCVLALTLLHPAHNQAQDMQHVFGDPAAWHWAPNRSYHVVNYNLHLSFEDSKSEIFGTDVVTMRPLNPQFRTFYLDSTGLVIDSVSLDGQAGTHTQLMHHEADGKLWITLDREYGPAATLAVRIRYHGFPRTGLFFVQPSSHYPFWPHEIYSQGEPSFNHFWFPCWDYPNDMATSETVTTVPDGQVVVSNGRLVSTSRSAGFTTYDWKESIPHSSYLISLAIGPWKKIHDSYHNKPVDYYVANNVDEATARRSFHLTPDMIGFFSRATGVEYPYEQYAQTAVFNFPFGGQENVSATTLTDGTLHDARAEKDYSSTILASHELGQHWFGDYVQGHDWANIWLNEGFATYLETLYAQYHEGTDSYRLAVYDDQVSEQSEGRSDYLRPIVDYHFADPLDMFDATTHAKGAAVLDMLRYVVDGSKTSLQTASQEQSFFRALKMYLVTHRTETAVTSDLVATFRNATGLELNWFFQEWVLKAGRPNYQVTAKYDAAAKAEIVTILQTQHGEDVPAVFEMPLELSFFQEDGEHKTVKVWNDQQRQVFTVPLDFGPLWVDFDPNDFIDKTVEFDQPFSAVSSAALHDPSVMARMWAVGQLRDASDASAEDRARVLVQVLNSDISYAVRATAAGCLGNLDTPPARTALLSAMSQGDSRVRVAVLTALGKRPRDNAAYQAQVDALRSDDSYAVQAAAARQIGSMDGDQSFDILRSKLDQNPEIHVRVAILNALAATHDKRAADVLLESAQPGIPVRVRMTALNALAAMPADTPSRELRSVVSAALNDSFFPLQLVAIDAVGHFKLNEYRSELAELMRTAPLAMQRNAAKQAIQELGGPK